MKQTAISIADRPAALFVSEDPSLASVLINHGIRVRDFLVLSQLAEQGPMSIGQLANGLGMEPEQVLGCARLLANAGFLTRPPDSTVERPSCKVRLTTKGQGLANRIIETL